MRVQIALTTLGLYTGTVNGTLDDGTKEAIKRYQIVRGIEANGLMTTETLNALSVPATQ
jgi:peptidoglycan hydrolase-like protein with peptidoglycan-binding domain